MKNAEPSTETLSFQPNCNDGSVGPAFSVLKRCFKCGEFKPRSHFYKHPHMGDGLLGKCAECCKSAAIVVRLERLKDEAWVMKERERCRIKQQRLRDVGLAEPTPSYVKERWAIRNPHKRRAQQIATQASRRGLITKPESCQQCGRSRVRLEKHHPDYSKPLEIIWLCCKCHGATRRKS